MTKEQIMRCYPEEDILQETEQEFLDYLDFPLPPHSADGYYYGYLTLINYIKYNWIEQYHLMWNINSTQSKEIFRDWVSFKEFQFEAEIQHPIFIGYLTTASFQFGKEFDDFLRESGQLINI